MGVDYGIFLLEHRDDGASWLAISLGAASTLLAFGLLVPAGTPVRLSPREHTDLVWLPWREAALRCYSPSNAEAILLLPRFTVA